MKPLFLALLCALTMGCAHVAKHYDAPDSTRLDASAQRLHVAVTAAKAMHKDVVAAVAEVKTKVADEKSHLDVLEPKLNNLFRIAPPELRDEIDAARKEAAAIREDNTGLIAKVDAITTLQAKEGGQIEEANAADKQHLADKEDFKAAADKQAEELNGAQRAWAKDSAELLKLKTESWFHRILGCLAFLAIGAIGFLYFTGKLALSGTKAAAIVAAKI